jgi:RNA polymerase sigma-70 factor (ECF subfamily)
VAPLLTAANRTCAPAAETARAAERQDRLADFRQFYLDHVEFVRRVAARLLGPRADVDDAVQEVFIVALTRRSQFRGSAEPSTWLYSIAHRVALAARRRARLRAFVGLEGARDVTDDSTPHRIFEHREASEQLYALLDRLSEKRRSVWILHELEGLTGQEIAAAVGCPLNTVWTRLFHARVELNRLALSLEDGSVE